MRFVRKVATKIRGMVSSLGKKVIWKEMGETWHSSAVRRVPDLAWCVSSVAASELGSRQP